MAILQKYEIDPFQPLLAKRFLAIAAPFETAIPKSETKPMTANAFFVGDVLFCLNAFSFLMIPRIEFMSIKISFNVLAILQKYEIEGAAAGDAQQGQQETEKGKGKGKEKKASKSRRLGKKNALKDRKALL